MMAVDLGTRTTKAVLMERRGEVLALSRYALLDAPIYEKKFSAELLSDHLRSVAEALGGATKFVTLAIGLTTPSCGRWSCRRSRWAKCGWC